MIDKKQRVNASTAYFLLAGLFLLPSKNKDINNDFVKKHSKSAFFIHILFLVTYLVFIYFDFLQEFYIAGRSINDLIAGTIFVALFWILIYGANKANKWEDFNAPDFIKSRSYKQILSGENSSEIPEREKIKFALSYVPFLGILINWWDKNSPSYISSKFSSLIALIIIVFSYYGKANSLDVLSLFYTIFIIFTGLFLIAKEEFILIDLKLPNAKELVNLLTTWLKYVKNLMFPKDFMNFKDLIVEIAKREQIKDIYYTEKAETKGDFPLNKYLLYVPFVNLVATGFIKSKYQNHIISGIIITIISALILFTEVNNSLLLLLVFPICYGTLNINNCSYRTPFIFSFYEIFKAIKNKIFMAKNTVNERYNTEKNLNLKTKNKD